MYESIVIQVCNVIMEIKKFLSKEYDEQILESISNLATIKDAKIYELIGVLTISRITDPQPQETVFGLDLLWKLCKDEGVEKTGGEARIVGYAITQLINILSQPSCANNKLKLSSATFSFP